MQRGLKSVKVTITILVRNPVDFSIMFNDQVFPEEQQININNNLIIYFHFFTEETFRRQ